MDRIRQFIAWLSAERRRMYRVGLVLLGLIIIAFILYRNRDIPQQLTDQRTQNFVRWFNGTEADRAELVTQEIAPCPGAPFLLPTYGYIGLLYGDPRGPYSERAPHQGIDIFSPGQPGEVPVVAAYDGYISRLEGWKSAVIQRIPDDPLYPGRQIWLYYTHMAPASGNGDFISERFAPGASEIFVKQGEFIGYTGNYSGTAGSVATHLHFSIVLDDGNGNFLNELDFDNTVDTSRYLGMTVNYGCYETIASCVPDPLCSDAVLGTGGG